MENYSKDRCGTRVLKTDAMREMLDEKATPKSDNLFHYFISRRDDKSGSCRWSISDPEYCGQSERTVDVRFNDFARIAYKLQLPGMMTFGERSQGIFPTIYSDSDRINFQAGYFSAFLHDSTRSETMRIKLMGNPTVRLFFDDPWLLKISKDILANPDAPEKDVAEQITLPNGKYFYTGVDSMNAIKAESKGLVVQRALLEGCSYSNVNDCAHNFTYHNSIFINGVPISELKDKIAKPEECKL